MENDIIRIEVQLTEDDAENYSKDYFQKIGSLGYIYLMCAAIMLLVVVNFFIGGGTDFQSLINACYIIIPLILLVTLLPIFVNKKARSQFKTNKLMQRAQHYELGQEGIHITSDTTTVDLKWDALYCAVEAKRNFLLFVSKQQAYVLPKRYFDTDAGRLEFMRKLILLTPVPKKQKKWMILFLIFLGILGVFILFALLLVVIEGVFLP